MWGFESLKDILQVLIIPVVLAILAVWLPARLESQAAKQKRDAFVRLICRELLEMQPDPPDIRPDGKWWQHLKKRFIHEAIFRNPSENRDFILSLDPDLAYNEAQMWIHFDKATASDTEQDIRAHAKLWCAYLGRICSFLDKTTSGQREKAKLYDQIYKPWEELVNNYYPGLVKG